MPPEQDKSGGVTEASATEANGPSGLALEKAQMHCRDDTPADMVTKSIYCPPCSYTFGAKAVHVPHSGLGVKTALAADHSFKSFDLRTTTMGLGETESVW